MPNWIADKAQLDITTPQKGQDIRDIAYEVSQLKNTSAPTTRVLFRKISKGIEQKEWVIAEQERKIKQLEQRVVQLQPRKRRKVVASPNSKFVDIQQIKKAQTAAGDRQIEDEGSDMAIELSSTLSHITIRE
jgi:hypothetical protein